jgi:hypothetical protein
MPMSRFRKMRRFVPWLTGLFLLAQFAGVAPLPVHSQPNAPSSVGHVHHHSASPSDQNTAYNHPGDQHSSLVDQCCSLHLITGAVFPIVTAVPIELIETPILAMASPDIAGISPNLLDRPPRLLLSL